MASSHSNEDKYDGILETGNPMEVTDEYWIWAVNRTNRNSRRPDQENSKCGKWLIFEAHNTINDTWETVKQGVTKGDLGFLAKVSTRKNNEEHSASSQGVICVYTYDWTDEQDVKRVRDGLRQLGLERKLPYKSDEDTIKGNYAQKGKRVSKYYY